MLLFFCLSARKKESVLFGYLEENDYFCVKFEYNENLRVYEPTKNNHYLARTGYGLHYLCAATDYQYQTMAVLARRTVVAASEHTT